MITGENQILSIAKAMVSHATERQVVLAENIANADTPGYRARDVQAFAEMFRAGEPVEVSVNANAPLKPNGNSVTLEAQVMNLAEARGQHEIGLGLWQKTMTLYRTALGRA